MKKVKTVFKTNDFEKQLTNQLFNFGEHLLVMSGLKSNSVNNMKKLTRMMLRSYKTLNPTSEQITEYIKQIRNKKYSYWHITNTSLAIERYSEFINNPIKLGRPKKPKRVCKDTLSEAEIAVMISYTKNAREKAMIALLAYSGIRCEELCNLRVENIDIGNNLLYVIQGKGSKDRTIPVAGACSKTIMEYLITYPRTSDCFLFTTLRHNNRFSEWALRRLIKKVAVRAKIKRRVHPHLFRSSLATNMLMRGANLLTIQQMLGHSNIQTTMFYITPKTTRLIAEYQAFAPCYI